MSIHAPSKDPASPLEHALVLALDGNYLKLFDHLSRQSGLPGEHPNHALCRAFAHLVAAHGTRGDRLIATLIGLDATRAPGATSQEFLPMCGVLSAGVRGGRDKSAFTVCMGLLHGAADDSRFRVREGVVEALVEVAKGQGSRFVDELASWTDGYFHGAAALRALSHKEVWPLLTGQTEKVMARFEEAFALAASSARAASRFPGFKALLEALRDATAALAAAMGDPVFEMLMRWSTNKDPTLREMVEACVRGTKLKGRHAEGVTRVRAVLSQNAPPRRDPRTYVGRTRGRGRRANGG